MGGRGDCIGFSEMGFAFGLWMWGYAGTEIWGLGFEWLSKYLQLGKYAFL